MDPPAPTSEEDTVHTILMNVQIAVETTAMLALAQWPVLMVATFALGAAYGPELSAGTARILGDTVDGARALAREVALDLRAGARGGRTTADRAARALAAELEADVALALALDDATVWGW